jgi:hypothetical protein
MEPKRVQLLVEGVVKLDLEASGRSLNDRKGPNGTYNGRATSAKIFGTAGSGVTFYDDQEFRTGQNSLYIEKLTDAPIEVFIAEDFVKTDEEIGSAVISGQEQAFKWVLFKVPKKDWFDEIRDKLGGLEAVFINRRACLR